MPFNFSVTLKLGEHILAGKFTDSTMAMFKDPTVSLDKTWRRQIIRYYVQHVVYKYTECFGNQHVLGDIMEYLAIYLTSTFPSLRDEDSTSEKRTFVSN